MNDLDFCKQQITAIAVQTGTDPKRKVTEFLAERMPIDAAHRSALRAWAISGLVGLSIPGGGVSRLVPNEQLAETSRQMTVLQTVIGQIDVFEREPG